MTKLEQLYSIFNSSTNNCYEFRYCIYNVSSFFDLIEEKENLFALIINNQNSRLTSLMDWGFHVVLLFWDLISNDWYILDYDADILIQHPIDKPITAFQYLTKYYCQSLLKPHLLKLVNLAMQGNYRLMPCFPKVSVLNQNQYYDLLNTGIPDDDDKSKASLLSLLAQNYYGDNDSEQERQSLMALGAKRIGYNNLGEFIPIILEKEFNKINTLEKYFEHALGAKEALNANNKIRIEKSLNDLNFWLTNSDWPSCQLQCESYAKVTPVNKTQLHNVNLFSPKCNRPIANPGKDRSFLDVKLA